MNKLGGLRGLLLLLQNSFGNSLSCVNRPDQTFVNQPDFTVEKGLQPWIEREIENDKKYAPTSQTSQSCVNRPDLTAKRGLHPFV